MAAAVTAAPMARVAGPSSSASTSVGGGGGDLDGSADSGSSRPSANGALFSADETRFMNDSLSSADSFDPFTVGAPGFKVPNVLPPHLGGIGALPGQRQPQPNDLPRLQESGPSQQHSMSASENNLSSVGPKGGYGQDKSWQQQQLEALQAQGNNRHPGHNGQGMFMGQAGPHALPDVSSIGKSLQGMDPWQNQSGHSGFPQTHFQGPMQHYPPGSGMPPPPFMAPFPPGAQHMGVHNNGPSDRDANASLGHLALQFPSSHQFPGAPGEPGSRQRMATHPGMDTDQDERGRGRSPSARPPWTLPSDASHMHQRSASTSVASPHGERKMERGGRLNSGMTGYGSASAHPASSATAALAGTMEPDAPYVFEPAPRPLLPRVDLEKAEKAGLVPCQLREAYFAPEFQHLQPHLQILREEQLRRKAMGLSANVRRGNQKVVASAAQGKGSLADGNADDSDDIADSKDKKKQPHALLTEAEKKANHIASEQKRRANIRKGYEMLCELVPALRESAEDGEGGKQAGNEEDEAEDDDANDEDGDSADGDTKRGKKRPIDGAGGTAGDNKGARSEATILMHAVEHIRSQLELHQGLLSRKEDAQRRLAEQRGINISLCPGPPTAGKKGRR